jgi:hypothetical protein
MANTGTATIDFGGWPGSNQATVAVTGQTAILAGSQAEAYMMADTTTYHNAGDHAFASANMGITCGTVVAGTGFTITAFSKDYMQGTYTVHWVWA